MLWLADSLNLQNLRDSSLVVSKISKIDNLTREVTSQNSLFEELPHHKGVPGAMNKWYDFGDLRTKYPLSPLQRIMDQQRKFSTLKHFSAQMISVFERYKSETIWASVTADLDGNKVIIMCRSISIQPWNIA